MDMTDPDMIEDNLRTATSRKAFNIVASSFNGMRGNMGWHAQMVAPNNVHTTLDVMVHKPGNSIYSPISKIDDYAGWGRTLDESVESLGRALIKASQDGYLIFANGRDHAYDAQQERFLPVAKPPRP
jgi:hypothetical protein